MPRARAGLPLPNPEGSLPTDWLPNLSPALPGLRNCRDFLGDVHFQPPENASLSSKQFISAARAQKVLAQG